VKAADFLLIAVLIAATVIAGTYIGNHALDLLEGARP
jgi:hypothetical protein